MLHIPARERYSQAVVETKQSGSGKVGDDTHNISACCRQPASVVVSIKPLVAPLVVAGLPMTSLLAETPDATISKTDVFGHVLEDWVRSPSQVVYSVAPSVGAISIHASYIK